MFEDMIVEKKKNINMCPYCNTTSISIIHIQVVNHMVHERIVLCNNCCKQWTIVYDKYSVVSISTSEND